MGVAMTVQQYLDDRHVPYDVIKHCKTGSSTMTAQACHVPGRRLAKGVVVKCDDVYLLAVVPATRHVSLDRIAEMLDGRVTLASEREASSQFPDCEMGAVPAIGVAYGLAMIVDEALEGRREVFFEGGDHRSLVHVTGERFGHLLYGVPHGRISA